MIRLRNVERSYETGLDGWVVPGEQKHRTTA
jgi:hypothetical protein